MRWRRRSSSCASSRATCPLPPALGLSSRKNLYVNPDVLSARSRDSVDAAFRRLTASWVRAAGRLLTCPFFEAYDRVASAGLDAVLLPPGVYTLGDLRAFGCARSWCPYFLARHMICYSREMDKDCVVVFDEAHNIDNVCIEALSVSIRRETLEGVARNLTQMSHEIDR